MNTVAFIVVIVEGVDMLLPAPIPIIGRATLELGPIRAGDLLKRER